MSNAAMAATTDQDLAPPAAGPFRPQAASARLEIVTVRVGLRLLRLGVNVLSVVEGPRLDVDVERAAAYDALLAKGAEIDYRLPYPRHELLSYAVERHGLLAHGSCAPGNRQLVTDLPGCSDARDLGPRRLPTGRRGASRPEQPSVLFTPRARG